MRYLSIDYGTKTTGLAVCDPSESIVSPLAAAPTAKNLVGRICEIVREQNIEGIVLGLPLNMDGSRGKQADIVVGFAETLKKHTETPIFFQDERLSTFAAEEKLVPRELTHKKKRARIDALAAGEILQAFLDSKNDR